jgi:peptidoglycan/LPS O-acetylase OafA/YrhL
MPAHRSRDRQEGPGAYRTTSGRIWFAHALRAVACLVVVATHYLDSFAGVHQAVANEALFPPLTGLPRPTGSLFPWMWVHLHFFPGVFGVALFFLVSGFVIPFSLESGGLRAFFVRRVFRLYPTFWASLALILAVLAVEAHRYHLAFPHRPAAIASNAVLLHPYLGHPVIMGVTWSLVVEELFYALAAVCAWRGLLRHPATPALAGLGLTALAISCSAITPGPATPAWQVALYQLGWNASFVVFIFVGVVLHHLYRGSWRLRVGLPVIVWLLGLYAVCICWGPAGRGVGLVPLVSSLAALAVFVPLLVADRWLPYSRLADWLARISYPLYLIHSTLGYIVIRSVYLRTGSLWVGFAAAFLVVVTLSGLVHRFVEQPGIALGRRLAARLTRKAAGETELRRAA